MQHSDHTTPHFSCTGLFSLYNLGYESLEMVKADVAFVNHQVGNIVFSFDIDLCTVLKLIMIVILFFIVLTFHIDNMELHVLKAQFVSLCNRLH